MNPNKKNICILFGGRSVEHEISVITALQLIEAIDREAYNPIPVYISQTGRWYTGNELLKKDFYKKVPAALEELKEVTLLPKPGTGGLTVLNTKKSFLSALSGKGDEVIPIDVFLPAFHGQYGEDGCIQGLFEMADVTYTGSDVLSSSVAMNKAICKAVADAHDIPVLPYILITKAQVKAGLQAAREEILKTPGLENFPLFVKPCNLGSSVGVSRAKDAGELDAALLNVFKYDDTAIIETCVTNIMEVNISVLDADKRIASVTEIPVGTDGVLSYEDKYMKDGGGKKGKIKESQGMASLVRTIDPVDLDSTIKEKVTGYALKLSGVLGASGVGRFDFIIDTAKNEVYFNELNPLPGSLSFYLWEKSKPPVIYTQLLNKIIKRAIERKESRANLEKNTGFKAMFG